MVKAYAQEFQAQTYFAGIADGDMECVAQMSGCLGMIAQILDARGCWSSKGGIMASI